MDIFRTKEIAELKQRVEYLREQLKEANEKNKKLKEPIEDHKNRYRTFTVDFVNGSFDIRCRRFTVDAIGYTFYEVDQTHVSGKFGGYHEDGYKVGHIPQRHVIKIFEKE